MYSAAVYVSFVFRKVPEVWVGFSHVHHQDFLDEGGTGGENADATVHEIKIEPQCITRTTLKKNIFDMSIMS